MTDSASTNNGSLRDEQQAQRLVEALASLKADFPKAVKDRQVRVAYEPTPK